MRREAPPFELPGFKDNINVSVPKVLLDDVLDRLYELRKALSERIKKLEIILKRI